MIAGHDGVMDYFKKMGYVVTKKGEFGHDILNRSGKYHRSRCCKHSKKDVEEALQREKIRQLFDF